MKSEISLQEMEPDQIHGTQKTVAHRKIGTYSGILQQAVIGEKFFIF